MRGKREKSLHPNEASLYKVRAQGSWGDMCTLLYEDPFGGPLPGQVR